MASYDSDASDEETTGYTETSVLLGYTSKEPTEDTFSRLGGYPTWLDERAPPSAVLAKCKVCNGPLSLLLQLNSDLPERFPHHERRLYLFSCRRKPCRRKEGSTRALRAVRVIESEEDAPKSVKSSESGPNEAVKLSPQEAKPQNNIGGFLFGGSSTSNTTHPFNPFALTAVKPSANTTTDQTAKAAASSAQPSDAVSGLTQTFADSVRITSQSPGGSVAQPTSVDPWPEQSTFPKPYPSYYLDADYETLDPEAAEVPPQARMVIDVEGGASVNNHREDKEAFESTIDKTFQRFADRLAENPEQVLRYEFNGQPLLYSKSDHVGKLLAPPSEKGPGKVATVPHGNRSNMPRCTNCGGSRVFELQLTPYAISELEAEELGLEGMDWGTVIIGVCQNDCQQRGTAKGAVGYVEEWVGVQWEELTTKR